MRTRFPVFTNSNYYVSAITYWTLTMCLSRLREDSAWLMAKARKYLGHHEISSYKSSLERGFFLDAEVAEKGKT